MARTPKADPSVALVPSTPRCGALWHGHHQCDRPLGHRELHRAANPLINGPVFWNDPRGRTAMPDYDGDVHHLATSVLDAPGIRTPDPDLRDRRIHSLAIAVQRTIEAWVDSHPLTPPEIRDADN